MADKILRNADGKEVGRIVQSGSEFILKDPRGKELGRYHGNSDVTKDAVGKIVGRGNLLAHLLEGTDV